MEPVSTAKPVAKPAPPVTPAAVAEPPPIPERFDLEVPGFEPALVLFPNTDRALPLVVVTHGAGGQAEWHCEHYRSMLKDSVVLLCPRGRRMVSHDPAQGYYYPDHLALTKEVLAATEALRAIAKDRLLPAPAVYAGYSQGATMGVLGLAEHADQFSRLVLVEGGFGDWSTRMVDSFRAGKGSHVLIVCGTKSCNSKGKAAVSLLVKAGIRAELRHAKGAGHRPDGPVEEELLGGLAWLLADAPGWQSPLP